MAKVKRTRVPANVKLAKLAATAVAIRAAKLKAVPQTEREADGFDEKNVAYTAKFSEIDRALPEIFPPIIGGKGPDAGKEKGEANAASRSFLYVEQNKDGASDKVKALWKRLCLSSGVGVKMSDAEKAAAIAAVADEIDLDSI